MVGVLLLITCNQLLERCIIIAKRYIQIRHPRSTTLCLLDHLTPKASLFALHGTVLVIVGALVGAWNLFEMLCRQLDFNFLIHFYVHVFDTSRCLHIDFCVQTNIICNLTECMRKVISRFTYR